MNKNSALSPSLWLYLSRLEEMDELSKVVNELVGMSEEDRHKISFVLEKAEEDARTVLTFMRDSIETKLSPAISFKYIHSRSSWKVTGELRDKKQRKNQKPAIFIGAFLAHSDSNFSFYAWFSGARSDSQRRAETLRRFYKKKNLDSLEFVDESGWPGTFLTRKKVITEKTLTSEILTTYDGWLQEYIVDCWKEIFKISQS